MVLKIIRREERGCGFRNDRGFYLVCSGPMAFCHRLPLDIPTCNCCGQYKIPYAIRGIAFINPLKVFGKCETVMTTGYSTTVSFSPGGTSIPAPSAVLSRDPEPCTQCPPTCPVCNPPDRGWYMSAGEQHYTMKSFGMEADLMGISKKVRYIPDDLRKGDYLFIGYRKAVYDCNKDEWLPQVFMVAPITSFEKLVSVEKLKDKEYMKGLEERGIDPVVEYDNPNDLPNIVKEATDAGFEPQVGKYEVLLDEKDWNEVK